MCFPVQLASMMRYPHPLAPETSSGDSRLLHPYRIRQSQTWILRGPLLRKISQDLVLEDLMWDLRRQCLVLAAGLLGGSVVELQLNRGDETKLHEKMHSLTSFEMCTWLIESLSLGGQQPEVECRGL